MTGLIGELGVTDLTKRPKGGNAGLTERDCAPEALAKCRKLNRCANQSPARQRRPNALQGSL